MFLIKLTTKKYESETFLLFYIFDLRFNPTQTGLFAHYIIVNSLILNHLTLNFPQYFFDLSLIRIQKKKSKWRNIFDDVIVCAIMVVHFFFFIRTSNFQLRLSVLIFNQVLRLRLFLPCSCVDNYRF